MGNLLLDCPYAAKNKGIIKIHIDPEEEEK
jgi:hypothetical protein